MASIYIADDESSIRRILTTILERSGHTVKSFPDVFSLGAALQAAAQIGQAPELVILDGTLQKKQDGFNYAVALRTQQRAPLIKVILLAAGDLKTNYHELCAAYGLTYIEKPASIEVIRTTVLEELSREY